MSRFFVLKFGGTSVSTKERWDTIGAQARLRLDEGKRVVVVCSAVTGVTNQLTALLDEALAGVHEPTLAAIEKKHRDLAATMGVDVDAVLGEWFAELRNIALGVSLIKDASPRLKARTLAMGELMSTRLGAAYLQAQGVPVEWVDARTLLAAVKERATNESRRYLTASCATDPEPGLEGKLPAGKIALTQGFIARNDEGETVLLGRGGSDTSASYLAAKLGAERLEIWTDVPGMFTANPKRTKDARLLKRLDYEEAQELAITGASVLQPRCIDPVKRHGIPLEIRWTQRPEVEGTVLLPRVDEGSPRVKAVSDRGNLVLVSMDTLHMWQQVGFLADVFQVYKRHGLSVDQVATAETNVTATLDVTANALDDQILDSLVEELAEHCTAKVVRPCAAVSIVGRGIREILPALAPTLRALEHRKIYLLTQAANDLNLTFVVDQAAAAELVPQLHRLIFPPELRDEGLGPTWAELEG